MNNKHTETPWIVSKDTEQPIHKISIAEYIVKAVNSHEALVEALRMARIALTPHVFIDDDAKRARNKADEALKQAGEL